MLHTWSVLSHITDIICDYLGAAFIHIPFHFLGLGQYTSLSKVQDL
jgi:hypothetical protein